MIKLSIIIVNYNVRHFLEQCLLSVRQASKGLSCEVIVVDNNSVDSSCAMVKEKFPEVILIESNENLGFSRANNLAIKQSNGEYILLLNPDTVIEEDTLTSVVEFMDSHPEAGGLGVKMVDGKGNFLPESKRSLPTPAVAFYKIFGLASIFPKSRRFGKYHLGYLDKDEIHEIEILSGAFMLLRKAALDKTGLLDESFFMYGEDIDLSYRILQAGYKNYYYPRTRIIHYKGESTKKSSINYVLVFYKAMVIFAKKHFSKKNAWLFSSLINFAVYLRALIAIVHRFIKSISLPLTDVLVIFGGFYVLKTFWENNIKSAEGITYPMEFMAIVVPAYILIWLLLVYFSGGYDKPYKLSKTVRGIIFGTGVILVIYGLLSESYRFSRALILLGAVWSTMAMTGIRIILNYLKYKTLDPNASLKKRIAVLGDIEEFNRVKNIINQSSILPELIIRVPVSQKEDEKRNDSVGSLEQLKEVAEIYRLDELIFCSKNISPQKIIDQMGSLNIPGIEFKIAPPESFYIIGSNSINTSGELYVIDINSITMPYNIRKKRILDFFGSIFFLTISPFIIPFIENKPGFYINSFDVLFGKKSWVGFSMADDSNRLPSLKPGILSPLDALKTKVIDHQMISSLNLLYAKDYRIENDVNIIFKSFRLLGRQKKQPSVN